MIGRSGERVSGISVLAARHDDDDDEELTYIIMTKYLVFCLDFDFLDEMFSENTRIDERTSFPFSSNLLCD